MKTKRFDCVEMMHRGARRVYRTTKGLSATAELKYWQERTRVLFPETCKTPAAPLVLREIPATYRIRRGASRKAKT
jgi:hypothetical protein